MMVVSPGFRLFAIGTIALVVILVVAAVNHDNTPTYQTAANYAPPAPPPPPRKIAPELVSVRYELRQQPTQCNSTGSNHANNCVIVVTLENNSDIPLTGFAFKAIVQDCDATCVIVGEAVGNLYPNSYMYVAPHQAREYDMLIKFSNLPNNPIRKNRRVTYEVTTLTGPPAPVPAEPAVTKS
jgi:hypothetical protein